MPNLLLRSRVQHVQCTWCLAYLETPRNPGVKHHLREQLYPAVLECRSHRLAGHTHRVRDRANHQIADQALLQCETKTHFTGIVLVVDGGLLCCLPNRNPMEKFFSLRKLLMELVSDVTPVTVTTSAPNVRVYTGSTRRPRIYASAPQTWPGP